MIVMTESKLAITPETRLKKLLEVYPQLEDVLIQMSPSFAKLKNPLLRKTVAKVATLQQIANVGNIAVSDLVNRLRREVGIEDDISASETSVIADSPPAWFDEAKVVSCINADEILDVGDHPLNVVNSLLRRLNQGEIVKLTASFTPDPLIEKFRSDGFLVWSRRIGPELVECYITAPES